jgi:hypothetical protein
VGDRKEDQWEASAVGVAERSNQGSACPGEVEQACAEAEGKESPSEALSEADAECVVAFAGHQGSCFQERGKALEPGCGAEACSWHRTEVVTVGASKPRPLQGSSSFC